MTVVHDAWSTLQTRSHVLHESSKGDFLLNQRWNHVLSVLANFFARAFLYQKIERILL
ncbi:hypothetical protein HMPREF0819_0834 [Streptococcus equinus ATCC 9812]|uniref:Uncharacterized protein n=1 Tax=Streptococcus equinus ATCC 9812 TaxID=525379 RepID=E8JPB1_STREI|nr:hypothetical protein HMPREF0819_0834 [Streptococcus equinus ATCC 9812]